MVANGMDHRSIYRACLDRAACPAASRARPFSECAPHRAGDALRERARAPHGAFRAMHARENCHVTSLHRTTLAAALARSPVILVDASSVGARSPDLLPTDVRIEMASPFLASDSRASFLYVRPGCQSRVRHVRWAARVDRTGMTHVH